MAKDITLLGTNYQDVPAVTLPQTGGGTATFYDEVGSQAITENGTYDVSGVAQAVVNVSGGSSSEFEVLSNNYWVDKAAGLRSCAIDDRTLSYIPDDVVGVSNKYGAFLNIMCTGTSASGQNNLSYLFSKLKYVKYRAYQPSSSPSVSFSCYGVLPVTINTDFVLLDNFILKLNLYGSNVDKVTFNNSIYVQDGLVESYKVATNWSNYSSLIKPISEWEYYGIY